MYNGIGSFVGLANQPFIIKEDSSNLSILGVERNGIVFQQINLAKEVKDAVIEDIRDVHKIDFGENIKNDVWLNECNRE